MTLPKSLTTVTTFSKILALFLFILLPIVGFILGMEYEKQIQLTVNPYYGNLKQQCNKKQSKSCCLSSIQTMESHGYKLAEKG